MHTNSNFLKVSVSFVIRKPIGKTVSRHFKLYIEQFSTRTVFRNEGFSGCCIHRLPPKGALGRQWLPEGKEEGSCDRG